MSVQGSYRALEALSSDDRSAMYDLLHSSYDGVSRECFDRDLTGKHFAILLHSSAGELCGFTTFAVVSETVDGEPLWVVYSGDTIVDRNARSSFALAQTWIAAIRDLREHFASRPWVWLLICSGVRTYRFLPVFFRRFFPRFDQETPRSDSRRLTELARRRYGAQFECHSGLVRLPAPQRLRGADDADLDRVDPHARYFLERNPGCVDGDELVCLTDLSDQNLTRAGRRMARLGERARRRGTKASA